jgi:hypothetical protein
LVPRIHVSGSMLGVFPCVPPYWRRKFHPPPVAKPLAGYRIGGCSARNQSEKHRPNPNSIHHPLPLNHPPFRARLLTQTGSRPHNETMR